MKAHYRKLLAEKRNPGCKGKYYKKVSCRSRSYLTKKVQD